METRKRGTLRMVLSVLLLLLGIIPFVYAQEPFPTRPVTVICQWGAGGNVDVALRLLPDPIMEQLGQPFVIKVMPGGQGVVGQNAMAKAKPDGYTIGLAALGPMVTVHLFDPKPPYKMTDFEAIAGYYENPGGFGVRKDAPWETLEDFIEDARKNPMKYRIGLHVAQGPVGLSIKKFILLTGIKVRVVPFQGGRQSTNAVLSGDVDACAMHVGFVVRDPDRFKLLALFEEKRSDRLPDVPMARELGYDLVMGARAGFVAPKGTPLDRIEKLESALKNVITDPVFANKLFDKLGMIPAFSSREALWAEWQDTYRRYEVIVQELQEAEQTFKELEEKK